MKRLSVVAIIILSIAFAPAAKAQSSSHTALYDTLARLDSALFSIAYTCQPDKIVNFFTEDLEFYHDKGGVMRGRDAFLETLKKNFCGPQATQLRRELVAGSLQVYAMDGYGAIQIGEHRFYVTQNGQPEKLNGIAKFTHLWQFSNNEWRISRVLSYDHQAAD